MTPLLRTARGRALLVAVALSALALPAAGATLILTGTPGAHVNLDGHDIGTLPMDAFVDLDLGRHYIVAELPGMETTTVDVIAETESQVLRVNLRLTPLSRTLATTQSLLLAGSGQRYEGRPTLGWVLTGVETTGLLTALVAELFAQNHEDEYLLARDQYAAAFTAADLAYWKAKMQDEHEGLSNAANLRDAALIAAGAAVLYSVVDAWLRFPSADIGPGTRPVVATDRLSPLAPAASDTRGFHLGWRLSF